MTDIPDEALVEKAAEALSISTKTDDWAERPEWAKDAYRYAASAALAAVAPDIRAQALRDAADGLEGRLGTELAPTNLYEFRQWLRARAEVTP